MLQSVSGASSCPDLQPSRVRGDSLRRYRVRKLLLTQDIIRTLVLYSGTAPLLSAFAAFVSLILSLICDLTSALSLKITIVPIIAWILQTSIWLDCEYEGSTVSTTIHAHCPQAYLEHHGADVARELSGGKVTLAWVTIAVELLYLYACVYEVFQLQCTPDRQLSEGSSLGDESDMGKRLNA